MKVIAKSEFDELFKEYIEKENPPLIEKLLNKIWIILQEKSFELKNE